MTVKMLLETVAELGPGIWSAKIRPHEVAIFGQPKATIGERTVLLAEKASFVPATACLQVDAGSVSVLNLGTTPDTLVLDAKRANNTAGKVIEGSSSGSTSEHLGPGDREFLNMVEHDLHGPSREAAERILREVRTRYPGDLRRGQRSNFKNTPDNFWYVIVQPRVQSLSVTVRGAPDRFLPSSFNLKDDRPGYTRFTLKAPSEVAEAIRIIELSKRR